MIETNSTKRLGTKPWGNIRSCICNCILLADSSLDVVGIYNEEFCFLQSRVEASRFLESDLQGAGSFSFLGVCKSGTGSFSPEPVPGDAASPGDCCPS